MAASTLFRLNNRSLTILCILICSLGLWACSKNESKVDPANTLHTLKLGNVSFEAEVVSAPEQMRMGLMYRTSLPENQGMLFIYPTPKRLSFWMLNTQIPLDIGYFTSDGVLRETHPMYPYNTDSIPSKRTDIQYALEMNQGWFAKNKVYPGAVLDTECLKEVLKK